MKQRNLLCLAACGLVLCAGSARAESASETVATGIGRGLINIVTSPGEIAHYVVYDANKYNVWGVFTGLLKGAGFTICRAAAGIADFVSLGFIPNGGPYPAFQLKPYVWEEEWVPSTPPTSATKETLYIGSEPQQPEKPVLKETLYPGTPAPAAPAPAPPPPAAPAMLPGAKPRVIAPAEPLEPLEPLQPVQPGAASGS